MANLPYVATICMHYLQSALKLTVSWGRTHYVVKNAPQNDWPLSTGTNVVKVVY